MSTSGEIIQELAFEGKDGCSLGGLLRLLKLDDAAHLTSSYQLFILKTLFQSRQVLLIFTPPVEDELDQCDRDGLVTLLDSKIARAPRLARRGQTLPFDFKEPVSRIAQAVSQFIEDCSKARNTPRLSHYIDSLLSFRCSDEYIYSTLGLTSFPDLISHETRLNIILRVAQARFAGYWQYAIAKDLELDPKTVFQHLKPLYKMSMIRRLALVLPSSIKKDASTTSSRRSSLSTSNKGQLSTSGIVWLSPFFDCSRISPEILRIHSTQRIEPFKTAAIALLSQQENCIMLERDFKAYFSSYFTDGAQQDSLMCSQKTVTRFFLKVRKELCSSGIVRRVRAWCPTSARIEHCVILTSSPAFSDTLATSLEEEPDVGIHVNGFYSGPAFTQASTALPDEDDVDDEEDKSKLYDAPLETFCPSYRVVLLLKALAVGEGIVSPTLASTLGSTTKKLTKVMASLESAGVVEKIAHRSGKYFMYKYFLAGRATSLSDVAPPKPLALDHVAPAVRPGGKTDGRAAARKIATEQFTQRLNYFISWILETGVCMIPEICKRYAEVENTPNGPDRKTILRLAAVALEREPRIKRGIVPSGAKGQEMLFFYNAEGFEDEAEAADKVRALLSERRSETCKEAMRRNALITRALQDQNTAHATEIVNGLKEENTRIEQFAATDNPVLRYNHTGILLPMVRVEAQNKGSAISKARHDQRLLAHYGFIFPIMVRLRSLYEYLLELAQVKYKDVSETFELSVPVIIQNMTLDTFLQLIGHGRREEFIEAYLHGDTPRCPNKKTSNTRILMKDLPGDVYERIVGPKNSSTIVKSSAWKSLIRLLLKLRILGAANWKGDAALEYIREDEDDCNEEANEERGVMHNAIWIIKSVLPAITFSEVDEDAEPVKYNMLEETDSHEFWNSLKAQCEWWSRRYGSGRQLEFCPPKFPISEAFSKKNWKYQVTIDSTQRNVLDAFAKELLSRAEEFQTSDGGTGSDVGASSATILNPCSSEIKTLAEEVGLSPDHVIRYLLRYFTTSGESKMSLLLSGQVRGMSAAMSANISTNASITLHSSRDLRYRCHLCGAMYAQKPSIINHYRSMHSCEIPEDESVWILPEELLKRKRGSAPHPSRRKRRRKDFGVAESPAAVRPNVPSHAEEDFTHRLFANLPIDDVLAFDIPQTGPKTDCWWSRSVLPLPFEERDRILSLGTLLTKREYSVLTELCVDPEDAKSKLMCLGPEARELLGYYEMGPVDLQVMKKIIHDARRDDEYGLIAFLALSERLFASECLAKKMVGAGDFTSVPPLNHPVWAIYATLFGDRGIAPAAAYFVVNYCLNRYTSSLNLRMLHTYRRLPGRLLQEATLAFSIPLKAEVRSFCSTEIPIARGNRGNLLMTRAILKAEIYSPPSRYRPWRFNLGMSTPLLSDGELADLWTYWNASGLVVNSKRSILKGQETLVDYWEALSRRKNTISRACQYLFNGKLKDWRLLRGIHKSLHRLPSSAEELYDGCRLMNTRGLTSGGVAAAVESISSGLIDIASNWVLPSADKLADEQAFPHTEDHFSGFDQIEICRVDKTTFLASLQSSLFTALEGSDRTRVKNEPLQDHSGSAVILTDTEGDHEYSTSEDDDVDEETEYEIEDDEETVTGQTAKGGVQYHLLKQTELAGDFSSPYWCPGRVDEGEAALPRHCRLLACDVDVNPTLCGTKEISSAPLDSLSPDTWLLPSTSLAITAFGSAEEHEKNMTAERSLEYEEDAANGWDVKSREDKLNEGCSGSTKRGRRKSQKVLNATLPSAQVLETVEHIPGSRHAATSIASFIHILKLALSDDDPLIQRVQLVLQSGREADFVSLLLQTHYQVLLSRENGVSQRHLLEFLLSGESVPDIATYTEDFLLAVEFLRTIRAICAFATPADWLLIAPQWGSTYTLKLQPWARFAPHGQTWTEAQWSKWITEDGIHPDDSVANDLVVQASGQKLADAIIRPCYVPRKLWRLYGPPLGSIKTVTAIYGGDVTVSVEERRAIAAVWTLENQRFGALRKLQKVFADLRATCEEMVEPAEQHLFKSTQFLTGNAQCGSMWLKQDGRLNDCIIATLTVRVYTVLRQCPMMTLTDIHRHIPHVDRPELRELIEAMVEEKLIVRKCLDNFMPTLTAVETPVSYSYRTELDDDRLDYSRGKVFVYSANPNAILVDIL